MGGRSRVFLMLNRDQLIWTGNRWNIDYMPVVKFIERLEYEKMSHLWTDTG